MAQAVTLWAPGLLNALRVKEAKEALNQIKLPGLQTLLAKGDQFSVKPQNFYQQASYLFHQPACLPIAATKASVELNSFDIKHFWLSVDPVQMVADRDTLVLIPNETLNITPEESKQLIDSFNAHFAQDKVQLIWASATHWYLSIVQPVDIQTTPLETVAFQSVNDSYPVGHAAQYWRQLINETQMLFYTHPVNEKRREKGWPEINSVWVWGEGQLNLSKIQQRNDAVIWSDNAYLQGMAQLAKAKSVSAIDNYQAWSKAIESFNNQQINKHLICLDDVVNSLDNLQISEWIELLKQLENDWFAPFLTALKQGRIDSLLLDLGQETRTHLKPRHLQRFWRFKKQLA